ncbi:MAG TPA: PA14 domain-containing protein, partial [Candidatus Hydrogenedentes bacterium]|nr:PA14 domain-containing protein [Candidatus Hydrogenedentota bacterium]
MSRIDNWALMGGEELNSGDITLTAGWHTVQLEYFENEGSAVCRLLWEGPGVAKSVIPDASTAYPWGLTGAYYSAGGTSPSIPEPNRHHTRVDSTVNFDWGTGDPAASGIGADSFATVWRGRVYLPSTGNWIFYTQTDDGARLWIDGTQRINQWVDQGPTLVGSGPLSLSAGWHTVEMHYYENGGGAVARLLYEGPGVSQQAIPASALAADRGLIGYYYTGNLPSASYRLERIDPEVNFNWDTSSPANVLGAENFSARWLGKVEAPLSGDYTFYVTSDDGVDLRVNGQLLINLLSQAQSPTEYSGTVSLTAGRKYFIDLQYNEFTGGAVCQLSWSGPGISKQII